MGVVKRVHLKTTNFGAPQTIYAVQNDTGRQLILIPDDYILTNGMTGKLTFERSDGTFYEAAGTLDVVANGFTVDIDQALTQPGRTTAQLKVIDGDIVSTFSFIIMVQKDTSGTISEQEGISLISAVTRAETAAARAEAAAEIGGGLTENIKTALLQIAQKIAYIDEHGQDYYDDLYDALYEVTGLTLDVSSISLGTIGATSQITATTVPAGAAVTWVSSDTSVATVANGLVTAVGYGSATITASAGNLTAQCSVVIAQATVTSISAVYTPSATIYETNIPSLDTLKSDLVVTAQWSNGTTSTVTDYTLSGTLSAGANTVTVSYGGQTTTITVTVVVLSSISAVFTQGSAVIYDTDSLDTLKQYLVVTANYADSTTQTVTGYTLSGTLTEGTSTITVSYSGKTTTFNVTVTVWTTSPKIEAVDKALSPSYTIVDKTGACITETYYFDAPIDAFKNTQYYDSANNYATSPAALFKFTYEFPNDAGISWSGSNKIWHTDALGEPFTNYTTSYGSTEVSNANSRANTTGYFMSDGGRIGLKFTLSTADKEKCYAFWNAANSTNLLPIGVSAGDIIFAGSQTPYYGKHNIND